jgi:hypothetical protein
MPRKPTVLCCQPFGAEVHGKPKFQLSRAISTKELNYLKVLVPEFEVPVNSALCVLCRIELSARKKTLTPSVGMKRSRILDSIMSGLRRKSPNALSRAEEELQGTIDEEEVNQVLNMPAAPAPTAPPPPYPGSPERQLIDPIIPVSPQESLLSAASGLYPMIPPTPGSAVSEYEEEVSKTEKINKILGLVEQSPFDRKKSRSVAYSARKLEGASKAITEEVAKASRRPITPRQLLPSACQHCEELIDLMVPRFQQLNSRLDKYKMLTSIPSSISISTIIQKFHCSKYMARLVSVLRRDQGPFSAPVKKDHIDGKISPQIKQMVIEFYKADENSRVMPGLFDTIYIRDPTTGAKAKTAKRQMLMSQVDFYNEFVKSVEERNIKISLTTVALLKPKNCIWPGIHGFKRTCMCEIHQNFQLLLEALAIKIDVGRILDAVLCDAVNERCSMGLCNECPNYAVLQEILLPQNDLAEDVIGRAPQDEGLNEEDVVAQREEYAQDDMVSYWQWTREGRTNLVNSIAPRHEVFDSLHNMIPKVAEHHFLLKQQNEFFKQLKVTVKQEESVIVHLDFAENYSFSIPDEVQGYHWTNNQMTIHPFYCQWSVNGNDLRHKTFAVISDCLDHNADTVDVFRGKFMEHLIAAVPNVKKIYFCSDGTGAQYKNYKNFMNVMELERKYNVKAEIHFTVSYHGKSECDAMSAQIKRNLRLASDRDRKIITNVEIALDHCVNKLTSETLQFIYVKKDEVTAAKPALEARYKQGRTIPGTRSFHCVKFIKYGEIETKPYSLCIQGKNHSLGRSEILDVSALEDLCVGAYVVINMLGIKTVGRIEARKDADGGFMFKPMKRRKGANSFSWPLIAHTLFISFDDFMFSIANPFTENGTVYKLSRVAYEKYDE